MPPSKADIPTPAMPSKTGLPVACDAEIPAIAMIIPRQAAPSSNKTAKVAGSRICDVYCKNDMSFGRSDSISETVLYNTYPSTRKLIQRTAQTSFVITDKDGFHNSWTACDMLTPEINKLRKIGDFRAMSYCNKHQENSCAVLRFHAVVPYIPAPKKKVPSADTNAQK
jgi:hypothetical protein